VAKGIPKRDGSGKGVGANRGRGGCDPPLDKNRRNQDKRGRILHGPSGGQWTSGKARSGPPNQQIENCGWLRKKKKVKK